MTPTSPLQEGQQNINTIRATIAQNVMTEQPVENIGSPNPSVDISGNPKRIDNQVPTVSDGITGDIKPTNPIQLQQQQPIPLPTSADDVSNNKFGSDVTGIPNANEFIKSRNTNIAQGITAKVPNIRDMSDVQLRDNIEKDLIDRGANMQDPEVQAHIKDTINNIKDQVRSTNPEYGVDDYYKRLVAGQSISDVNNRNARHALDRFQNVNKYQNMDEVGLTGAISTGSLIPGSQARNDLTNLGMGKALQAAQAQSKFSKAMKVKSYLTDGTAIDDTKSLSSQSKEAPVVSNDHLTNIAGKVLSDMPAEQHQPFQQALSEDQQIVQQSQKINDISKQEDQLKIQLQRLRDDALAMSIKAGTGGLESGYLDAYVSEKSKPIIWKMEALSADKAAESNLLQTLVQNRQFKFDQERKQKSFAEEQRQFNMGFGQKQYEFDQEMGLRAQQVAMDNRKPDGNGNYINLQTNEVKSPAQMMSMQSDLSNVDFTGNIAIQKLYPNEASLKNNNPAGIKSSISDRTKQLLQQAGVQRKTGSTPPPNEGGRYMQFATAADGMLAHKVLLTKAGTDDVNARLQQRVGTSNGPAYASQLMSAAGIPKGAKFSQLDDNQINKIVQEQMKRESPGFAREISKISGTQQANGDQSPLIGIANTIIASSKFTKDQANSIRKGINEGKNPVTIIKNQAKFTMENEQAKNVSAQEKAVQDMQNLSSLLSEYYNKGGSTSLLKGNMEKVQNSLGSVGDPKLSSIATRISTAIQSYRKAISGTAFSAQEGADIDSVFPGINKSKGLNNAILSSRIQGLRDEIDISYRVVLGDDYDLLKQYETQAGVQKTTGEMKGMLDKLTSNKNTPATQGRPANPYR